MKVTLKNGQAHGRDASRRATAGNDGSPEIIDAEAPAKETPERLAYKPNDAAALLGIGRNRVFELLRSGELASVKYGRTRLIPRKAIERFLNTEAA